MKFFLVGLLVLCSATLSAQKCFLEMSNGGGFTGAVTVYRVTPDGKVLKGGGLTTTTFTEEAKLSKGTAKKYLKRLQKIVVASPGFSHPGNMYYSLTFHDDRKDTKLTWGDASYPAPADAKKLFEEIQRSVGALAFAPVAKTAK